MADAVMPDYVVRNKDGEGGKPDWATARESAGRPRTKSKNHEVAVAQRRLKMATMCADGITVKAIAEEMGVGPRYVYDEINAYIDEIHEQALEVMSRKVAREIAVLNMVQLEATIAWYESKEGKVTNMKKRKKEIRSAFVNTSKRAKFGAVKTGEALGMSPLEVQQKARSTLGQLFAEAPTPEPPGQFSSLFADNGQGQTVVQLPQESEEEYERIEHSVGAPEFLRIILDCIEKRARLQRLFAEDDNDGYDKVVNLTPEERKNRLTALVQDIRAAKAIAEGNGQAPLNVPHYPLPEAALAQNIRPIDVAAERVTDASALSTVRDKVGEEGAALVKHLMAPPSPATSTPGEQAPSSSNSNGNGWPKF